MFNFLKGEKPFDANQYELLKQLATELPGGPGWAVTYEKEIPKATIKKLESEGFRIHRMNRTDKIPYYKISKQAE